MPEKKEKYQEMKRLLQSLGKSDIYVVPTEKTNRFRSISKY